jgi:hypothetical protein
MKALGTLGALFDLDTDLWAHPWVATTVGSTFNRTLGRIVSFSQNSRNGTAINHHWRLPSLFSIALGGGMYLCQTLRTMFEDCSLYTRGE